MLLYNHEGRIVYYNWDVNGRVVKTVHFESLVPCNCWLKSRQIVPEIVEGAPDVFL